jgi:hypothetical protein
MPSSNEPKPSTRRNQPGTIGYYRDLEHEGGSIVPAVSCKGSAVTARAIVDSENLHPHGLPTRSAPRPQTGGFSYRHGA